MTRSCIMRGILISALLLVGTINADGTCKKGCPRSDNGILKYTPGSFYEYGFESILTVSLGSGLVSEADDTSLKVTGSAKVFASGNCGYTLQIGSVKVINTKESVEKKLVTNIQKPVHFTWVSGQLEPEICVDASDSAYSLNIKRAIISLLQTGSGSEIESEVDVFGQCPTHVSSSTSGNGVTITKVRDLNKCAYREHINSGLLAGVVNEKAGVTSSSLLKSDYSKESRIERGVVERVQLEEIYKFAGSAKGSSDISAKVQTTLKLKNGANGTPGAAPATSTHGASIIFQKSDSYPTKNIAALKTALADLVDLTSDYVKKDTAKKFIELIRLLRNSDTDTLLELSAVPHPNKLLARKVYLDALFRTNTAESAKAILRQLPKFEEKEKLLAILSLNLVESVDRETLNQAAGQLVAQSPKEIYLVVGNLISKFCARNGCQASDLESISKKFVDGLRHCRPNTKQEEERIVYVLKGIGNTHHLVNNLIPALTECVSPSPGRSNRVRVAALQSFSSSSSCNGALSAKALDLLKDHNEDSELRIEAYLAAINCPSAELANQLSEIINSEEVYQVGGFIESSLKTIRDSTDAAQELQRYHLANIRVTKQFPKDYRRYSFNNGFSYRLDALGLSASSDYKLIYSQHGFLPRSARLNLTTEIFGTSFNVFEASVRQENLENLLEYYVGPKGLLNKDFDEIVKLIEVGNAQGGQPGRHRRSIADDASKTAKKYKNYGSKTTQDLNLDLSLKLFGSELSFLSLGDNIPSSLDDIIKHFSDAFDKAKKELSSFEKQFIGHHLFLDVELSYPTGLGVPLEFGAQGFASNKIDFAISVDVNDILEQNWQRSKYRLKFVPSVDVNVNAQLGFNTQVLSTGLRVVSTAHSATGSDVSVSLINNGQGFNVDVDLPRDRLELVDVQFNAEFFVAENDKQIRSVPLKASKKASNSKASDKNEICFNQLEIVGLNVCVVSSASLKDIGTVNSPANQGHLDNFHLSKPFSLVVYSTVERKFNFKGTHSTLPSGSQQWKLEYSTPGSKVSHDTSIAFELGANPKTYARLALDNPQYHLAVEAGVSNDNHELVIYGQLEQDKDVKRSKVGFAKNGNEYKPLIEIHDKNGITNNINGYRADGKIVVQKSSEKQARYNFQNFQIISPNNERVVLNGWADVGTAFLTTELHIAPGPQSYLVKSHFKLENGQYAAGLFVNDERNAENVYGTSAKLTTGQNLYSLQVIGKAWTWSVKSTSDFEFVKNENPNTNIVSSSKFSTDLTVDHKNKPVGSLKAKSNFDANKFQIDAEAAANEKTASLNIKFESNQKSVRDYEFVGKAKLNKHFIEINSKAAANGNILNVDHSLVASCGTVLTAKGELGQRYTAQDVHIDLQGGAQFGSADKPLQWLLKVLGTPEKTNTEFRASRDNAELIKLTTESQHPLDKISAAKFNLVLKNQLNAKGDFKIAKNGKGELTTTIETQKTDPKHKIEIDSKFHVLAPKFDIDTSVTIDGAKKLHLKTENIVDKLKFSTKNVLESDGKKVSVEANGALKGDWRTNGDIQGAFTFTCPDGHTFEGSLNRHVTTNPKTHLAQGTAELTLNEQEPNNGRKRSIDFKGKLDKMNTKTKEISVSSQLVYTAFNGQKAELNYHLKHLPKGENKAIDFGATILGNFPDQIPVELSVVIDEYSSQHAIGRISGKLGERVSANFNGKYHVGQNSVPSSYEVQGKVQVPESNFKYWELSSKGKLLKPTEGVRSLEFQLNSKTGDAQFTNINTIWKGTTEQGSLSFDAQNNNLAAPLKLDVSYQNEQKSLSTLSTDKNGKWKYGLNGQYGDKYVKINTDVSLVDISNSAAFNWKLDTSYDSVKNIEISIRAHKAAEESYVISSEFKNADKSYSLESKLYRSSHKKGFDLHANLATGETIVLATIIEILGERKAKLTVDIENIVDLDFKLGAEASYTNIDDFYIIGNWNSKKLKFDNYVLDVKAQTKIVKVLVKNAQGVVLSGNVSYNLKKDQNKSIIEGQGQVQTHGKTVSSNFKLTRQYYTLSTEQEVGFSYTFNGNVGPKNIVATLKLTNKEFNLKNSICEEKRQCTNIQIQSSVSVDENQLENAEHGVVVVVDLREIGYPYELEWKSKSIRKGFKYEYNLDGHISGNNLKYQLNANVLPTGSTVKLTLPKRQILFETVQSFPTSGKVFGHYEQSAAFYIDKLQRPNDVARVSAILDISGVEHVAFNSKGQLKIEHPTIRPLSVSGSIDANRDKYVFNSEFIFDIFKTADQKVIATNQIRNTQSQNGFNITSNQKLYSTGLQFQFELDSHSALNTESTEFSAGTEFQSNTFDLKAGALIVGNKNRVELSVNGLNEQIVHVTANLDLQKHTAKINSKLQVFGHKPVEIVSELQPNWAKVSLNRQNLINANAEIKLGKEFKFDVLSNGKSISNGRVALDATNFLQTAYKINEDEVKAFQTTLETEVKKETDDITEKIKKRFDKVRSDLDEKLQLVKKSTPDFDKLKNGYESQLKSIVDELESDPTLAKLFDSIRQLVTKITKFFDEVTKTLSENYEKLSKAFEELFEKLHELWKNSILKAWEQLVVSATKLLGQVRVEIFNVYAKAFKGLIEWLEKYGPALKNYGKAINEWLKPVYEAAQELIKSVVKIADEAINELKEYVAKLPTFNALRDEFTEKIKQLKLVEQILDVLNNVFAQLHILPQTPETNELLEKLHEYLEAKLKQQPINDEKVLEDLSKLLIKSIRSIWSAIESNTGRVPAADVEGWTSGLPHYLDELVKIPTLFSFRSSLINFILNENWETIFSKDLYSSWLYSVLFQKFELHGLLVNGQHVFSFDGQTYAYPGNCKYILAQDSVDNNFTVIAQLNDGKLKSITLTDRDGNFMEISDTIALKVNNKPVEYPQHLPGIHAWRKFYSVYLHSEYGVTVTCTTDLKVCHVAVNGFYTSKTRGLLGNGNAEPYDDYLLIDGTLAKDSAALGNDYGIGKCNPVAFNKAHLESQTRNNICSEIFGIESTLALNFLALDSRPYRKACDIAVQDVAEKDKESVACTFALAYGSALKHLDKLVLLPPRCLKCAGAVGQRELGEEFTVKAPTNKADVVFVVDINVTPKVLSNLVAPAITEIRDALKTRGFTDVQVGVIAFDESKRYPALLTSDNGKINYKGNVANTQLNGPKNFCDNCIEQIIADKRALDIYNLLEKFIKTIVPQSDENAFKLALDYPFRAGAAKTIIGVRSDSLEYGNWWKLVRAHITGTVTKFDGALLHLIAPIKGLALDGVPVEKLVGFNARLVATLDGKDNKKRPKLQFENDMGIDFVLNNGGWAFATQNFDKLKAADQKKVLNQVTSSIADTLFKTETVSDCRCVPVHGLFGQHKCAIKSTTFVPNKKTKAT